MNLDGAHPLIPVQRAVMPSNSLGLAGAAGWPLLRHTTPLSRIAAILPGACTRHPPRAIHVAQIDCGTVPVAPRTALYHCWDGLKNSR